MATADVGGDLPVPQDYQGLGLIEFRRALAAAHPDDVLYISIGELPAPIMTFAIWVRDIVEVRSPDPPQPPPEQMVVRTGQYLNVRVGPGTGYKAVGRLENGQRVQVRGDVIGGANHWAQLVDASGKSFDQWVAREFLIPAGGS